MGVVNFEQQEERSAPEDTEREPQAPPADNSGEDEEQQSALEEFPIECLPPILAGQAKAISELGRWPLRLTAPLVLAAASASLGRGIRVRSYDGHETRPNFYLLIGKESGSGGTSAFRLAFAAVHGFQTMKRREFANGLKPILEGERATHESEIEYLKRQARGKKSADERREISKQISEVRKALQKLDKELAEPCFLTGDATPQGMTRLLAEHGETLCHARGGRYCLDFRAL
jgi:replicative DNA helicase